MPPKKSATSEPQMMAIDCHVETQKPLLISSKIDFSEFCFYIKKVTFDLDGSGAFAFDDDFWDGELNWDFSGAPEEFYLSVNGYLRIEMSYEFADWFDGIPEVGAVIEIEFRRSGDSPPFSSACYKVKNLLRANLTNLKMTRLD